MFTFLKDIQCLQTNHVLASCQQARTEELCSSLFTNELEYYGAQTETETESETEQTEMHENTNNNLRKLFFCRAFTEGTTTEFTTSGKQSFVCRELDRFVPTISIIFRVKILTKTGVRGKVMFSFSHVCASVHRGRRGSDHEPPDLPPSP